MKQANVMDYISVENTHLDFELSVVVNADKFKQDVLGGMEKNQNYIFCEEAIESAMYICARSNIIQHVCVDKNEKSFNSFENGFVECESVEAAIDGAKKSLLNKIINNRRFKKHFINA